MSCIYGWWEGVEPRMSKSIRRKLCWAVLIVALVNAADLASTYLACPDLSAEWNVLHSRFGLGWAGLIGAKVIGGFLAAFGYAYYLAHRDSCYPQPGASQSDFCRFLSFGKPASCLELRAGNPGGAHLGVNLGYFWAGMQLLVAWVALDNLLLYRYGWYMPWRHFSEFGYHMVQSAVVGFVVLLRFYCGNYVRYLRASSTALAAAPLRAVSVEC
jgi:hypothetical protein